MFIVDSKWHFYDVLCVIIHNVFMMFGDNFEIILCRNQPVENVAKIVKFCDELPKSCRKQKYIHFFLRCSVC